MPNADNDGNISTMKVVEELSYKAKLPSTGRDLLLVGASHLTQSLAAALVQVRFDQSKGSGNAVNNYDKQHKQEDPAIEALRKHCCFNSTTRQRHVHTAETLQQLDDNEAWNETRIDHIAYVISTSQQVATSKQEVLEEARQVLSDDYILLQRVTIVEVQEGSSNDQRPSMMRTAATVSNNNFPTFQLQLDSPSSHLTVARMLWQRTKLGTREGTPTLPHVNPVMFGTYASARTSLR
jgi:hypothetical protein